MRNTIKLLTLLVVFTILPGLAHAQLLNTVVALTGNIFDAVSKEPVTAFITVKDETGKRINASRSNAAEKGYYYITGLHPGKKYTILINKQEYFNERYELLLAATDKYEEISKDFLVNPMKKDVQIPLPVPPFELNKTKLRVGAEDILNDIKNTLVNNQNVKVKILCYPDDDENPGENEKLTSERCKSIMGFFSSHGIDVARMTFQPSKVHDPKNAPPTKRGAKGKRYIGPSYIVVTDF